MALTSTRVEANGKAAALLHSMPALVGEAVRNAMKNSPFWQRGDR